MDKSLWTHRYTGAKILRVPGQPSTDLQVRGEFRPYQEDKEQGLWSQTGFKTQLMMINMHVCWHSEYPKLWHFSILNSYLNSDLKKTVWKQSLSEVLLPFFLPLPSPNSLKPEPFSSTKTAKHYSNLPLSSRVRADQKELSNTLYE